MPVGIRTGVLLAWFLARSGTSVYLPEPWQWPVIATMIGLGLLAYYMALRMYTTHRRQLQQAQETRSV